MILNLNGETLGMEFLAPSKELDIEKETWYPCAHKDISREMHSPSGEGLGMKLVSMDLEVLRLRYLLGMCSS